VRPDAIKVLQWPIVEPVSLTEARQQVGMMPDQTEFDAFLLRAIATGRRLIEKRLGATLVATQYRASWTTAPAVLDLPNPPLLMEAGYPLEVQVEGVTVNSQDYEVDAYAMPATVNFDSQPAGKVVATYWAGVAPGTEIEPTIKSALLMYVSHAFENRGILADGPSAELPQGFEMLLAASSWNGGY
jgi:uncharacterized phiE125 gp8 family phage protein